ncbi:MAG: hypothetical protein IJC48_07015 [Clostridia bacterium]|nr:hypothetical protein [Clostridia bacterium]
MLKKILALGIAVCMFALSGLSEIMPNEETYPAYRLIYNEEELASWKVSEYLDKSGLILSAFLGNAEITVSVNEMNGKNTPEEYLSYYLSSASRYAEILTQDDFSVWDGISGEKGASVRYTYRYTKGEDTDHTYQTNLYACKVGDAHYAVFTLNVSGDEDAETIIWFEGGFLPGVSIENVNVSHECLAYLKDAEEMEGRAYLTLDFCAVKYDASIFTIFTVNDEPADYKYPIAEDALIWTADTDGALYGMKRADTNAEALKKEIGDYYARNQMHGIYRVLFNEKHEIIWMTHYNAF